MPESRSSPRPRALATALAAVLAGAGVALSALVGPLALIGQAHPHPRATTNPAKTYADQAVVATNRARTSRELAKVTVARCLRDFAVAQAKRMASSSSTYNQSLGPVLRDCDLDFVGETVAWGFPNGTSVVAQGWMRSTAQRATLMNEDFTMIGVAARKDARGKWYVSQVLGGR